MGMRSSRFPPAVVTSTVSRRFERVEFVGERRRCGARYAEKIPGSGSPNCALSDGACMDDKYSGNEQEGTVGQEWAVAGFGPISGAGDSDMVLRNRRTGAFEVYDIANDALSSASSLGQVGRDWQIGGFAADPPPVSGTFADMSNDQLVQAMAGFTGGSGAGEGLNTAPLGADTSQQTLLTTPQHA